MSRNTAKTFAKQVFTKVFDIEHLLDWFWVDDLKAMVGNSPLKYLTQASKLSLGTYDK